MKTPEDQANRIDDSHQYVTCKGLLVFSGMLRATGGQPRCIGHKSYLPPDIVITEEDVGSKFLFIGLGLSVYNKDMLSKNRLPLVNGFSQLMTSKEYEEDKSASEAAAESESSDGRRQGHQHRQPPPQPVETPAGAAAGVGVPGRTERQDTSVPASMGKRNNMSGGESRGGGAGGKEGAPGSRDQLGALVTYAVGRVNKQVEVTKQVGGELTKLTPAKLREAAGIQANKVQEMPTLLADTSRRMVRTAAKIVKKIVDAQDRKT